MSQILEKSNKWFDSDDEGDMRVGNRKGQPHTSAEPYAFSIERGVPPPNYDDGSSWGGDKPWLKQGYKATYDMSEITTVIDSRISAISGKVKTQGQLDHEIEEFRKELLGYLNVASKRIFGAYANEFTSGQVINLKLKDNKQKNLLKYLEELEQKYNMKVNYVDRVGDEDLLNVVSDKGLLHRIKKDKNLSPVDPKQ